VTPTETPSPCIGVCTLDAEEICHGCGRSLEEIAGWPYADEAGKQAIVRLARQRVERAAAEGSR
jgi:predicted Fe-S protein YdhL (DUF1289 family)